MTIGNQLKKARQKKQLSLDEVYQQTRIHPDILTALEGDRFEKILAPAYIRSFLKEYAAYLGLDAKRMLNEYDKLYSEEKHIAPEPRPEESRSSFPKIDLEKVIKIGGIIVVSVLAVMILVFLLRVTSRAVSKLSQQIASRSRRIRAERALRPEKAPAPKSVSVKQKILPPKTAGPSEISIPADERLRLSVTAADNVWLQIKVDGKIIFQNVLRKGSTEEWQADDNFELWTGNAEATLLNLNGIDLGTPGRGVKKGVLITREGMRG